MNLYCACKTTRLYWESTVSLLPQSGHIIVKMPMLFQSTGWYCQSVYQSQSKVSRSSIRFLRHLWFAVLSPYFLRLWAKLLHGCTLVAPWSTQRQCLERRPTVFVQLLSVTWLQSLEIQSFFFVHQKGIWVFEISWFHLLWTLKFKVLTFFFRDSHLFNVQMISCK